MKISTIVLVGASILAPLAEAQGRCYWTRNHGWRPGCRPCRRGHRFVPMGECNPRYQCCRGWCCRRWEEPGQEPAPGPEPTDGPVPPEAEPEFSIEDLDVPFEE